MSDIVECLLTCYTPWYFAIEKIRNGPYGIIGVPWETDLRKNLTETQIKKEKRADLAQVVCVSAAHHAGPDAIVTVPVSDPVPEP